MPLEGLQHGASRLGRWKIGEQRQHTLSISYGTGMLPAVGVPKLHFLLPILFDLPTFSSACALFRGGSWERQCSCLASSRVQVVFILPAYLSPSIRVFFFVD